MDRIGAARRKQRTARLGGLHAASGIGEMHQHLRIGAGDADAKREGGERPARLGRGMAEQGAGKVQKAVGNAKEGVRRALKN